MSILKEELKKLFILTIITSITIYLLQIYYEYESNQFILKDYNNDLEICELYPKLLSKQLKRKFSY
jgi:hypothetical protein